MSGRPYAEVIGDPIAHSKSPLIHNFWLGKLGIDAEYRACHVRPGELADYFMRRRGDAEWRGCNVTIPYKVATLRHLDRMENASEKIGAVNCVVPASTGLLGSNTDVDGVRAAIGQYPWADVCLLGNGGAARSALWYLSTANKDVPFSHHRRCETRIVARDKDKTLALLKEFGLPGGAYGFAEAELAIAGVVLVINSTSLGMTGQPPIPGSVTNKLSLAYADATVFDMVYSPLETQLLRKARENGMSVVDGLTMLIGQAGKAFQLFFGAQAPRQYDAELRALLTA